MPLSQPWHTCIGNTAVAEGTDPNQQTDGQRPTTGLGKEIALKAWVRPSSTEQLSTYERTHDVLNQASQHCCASSCISRCPGTLVAGDQRHQPLQLCLLCCVAKLT